MPSLIRKSFDTPDETRPFEAGMGRLEVINTDDGVVGRATFEPGWQWSKHVKPIAGPRAAKPRTPATSSRPDEGRDGRWRGDGVWPW